jgi:hypothetical protein
MSLFDDIVEIYPELTSQDFEPKGSIELRNDGDDFGDYISKWDYSKPIPKGMKLGKPKA